MSAARIIRRVDADRGATAVEYAIMAALVAAVVIGVVGVLGTAVRDLFDTAIGTF